jgi:hypothetical protein
MQSNELIANRLRHHVDRQIFRKYLILNVEFIYIQFYSGFIFEELKRKIK